VVFLDVESSIILNGGIIPSFSITRSVRQSCPLVPYLFFLVGEVLNILINDVMLNGMIEGIVMPNSKKEKTLYQYADDIFLTLVRDEDNINNVMSLFNKFSEPAY
jgi:hypothetical protein